MTELPFDVPQERDPATGLPIGPEVKGGAATPPGDATLTGRFCRLEPLDAVLHGDGLYAASTPPDAAERFRYLPDLPPASRSDFDRWLERAADGGDVFYAVIDLRTGQVGGRQAFMRIAPAHRSIEIGNIYWGPAIARSPVTTEANYLFARHAFEALGYRRYEWKCDALNAPSRRAAARFGFTFEGQFRRAVINRGRTRDTAWYSIIDEEWPALRSAYDAWLMPENFAPDGQQRRTLQSFIANPQKT